VLKIIFKIFEAMNLILTKTKKSKTIRRYKTQLGTVKANIIIKKIHYFKNMKNPQLIKTKAISDIEIIVQIKIIK